MLCKLSMAEMHLNTHSVMLHCGWRGEEVRRARGQIQRIKCEGGKIRDYKEGRANKGGGGGVEEVLTAVRRW